MQQKFLQLSPIVFEFVRLTSNHSIILDMIKVKSTCFDALIDPKVRKIRNKLLYCDYIENNKLKYGFKKNFRIKCKLKYKFEKELKNDKRVASIVATKLVSKNLCVQKELEYARLHPRFMFKDESNMNIFCSNENSTFESIKKQYTLDEKEVKDCISYSNLNNNKKLTNELKLQLLNTTKTYSHWMTDYEVYNDALQTTSHNSKYGTPNPYSQSSSIPCGGCGALLHCKDNNLPGYLPSELYAHSSKDVLKTITCQRCHFMKYYNTCLYVRPSEDNKNLIKQLNIDKKAALILLIDLTDFPCSIWSELSLCLNNERCIFIVGNKIDLLPRDSPHFLDNIRDCLKESIMRTGISKTNIKYIGLISAKTGYGVEELVNKMHTIWQYKANCTWKNPSPQSYRFCRLVRIALEKETLESILTEYNCLNREISTLTSYAFQLDNGQEAEVSLKVFVTLLAEKCVNAIVENKATWRCNICFCTNSQSDKNVSTDFHPIDESFMELGLGLLHAEIKAFGNLTHISYRLPLKTWTINANIKGNVYLIGCTNSGKSTLFNALLHSDFCKAQAVDLTQFATTSHWPGTTLNLLKFPIFKPTSQRIFERMKRLLSDRKKDTIDNQLKYEEFRITGKIELTTLKSRVTHTFKKRKEKTEVINQLMSKDVPIITSKTKIGLNDMSDEYRYGHWCYDTPGTINDDQILNILTTNELTKTLPGKIISPRTFCMWADQTIFIAGLGRLDIVEASHFIRCTVFASEHLPITICKEKDAKEVYKKLIKTEAFTVPCNDHIRLKRWPELKFKEFEIVGVSQFESSSDIVLSSAGWIAIAASYDNIIRVKAWTPLARGIYLRSPSLLPKSVNFRGIRRVGSPAYQSGQQIYIN